MEQLFVSSSGKLEARWLDAFPEAQLARSCADIPAAGLTPRGVVWLDTSATPQQDRLHDLAEAVAFGWPVVVMAATPSEGEAFQMLNAGAVGYCHVKAVPEQLREVSLVVQNGGIWMPAELMQRFVRLSTRVMPAAAEEPELNELTSRELMVAEQVAHGASNREIAENLKISERTVKAHLSAIFEKLGVRDRVQLALAMNKVPIYTSVN